MPGPDLKYNMGVGGVCGDWRLSLGWVPGLAFYLVEIGSLSSFAASGTYEVLGMLTALPPHLATRILRLWRCIALSAFMWALENQTRVFTLACQVLCPLGHLLSPVRLNFPAAISGLLNPNA